MSVLAVSPFLVLFWPALHGTRRDLGGLGHHPAGAHTHEQAVGFLDAEGEEDVFYTHCSLLLSEP